MVKEILEIVRDLKHGKNRLSNKELVKELALSLASIDQQIAHFSKGGLFGRFDKVLEITRNLCVENDCLELYMDLFKREYKLQK